MGAAFFYHMTTQPVDVTLPMLLGKARGAGWRVAVRGRDAARLDHLDGKLWEADGFLAHGLAGGPHDAEQPILLTEAVEAPNGASCLVSLDGAEIAPEEVNGSDRTMILFDGNDGDAVSVARQQWKLLTEAGCTAQYWAQDGGSWAKKAEHPKPEK
ncbi:DNA polymerase III chi subunit [Litoreibacter halocynthiae]|uniref:DNA polymerase III chi subunit n=1 Tax=Litoreibacter halocynthiae TaxID=1242689 RepID=A0A4R7LNF2_9RHOB|nr:DNA polymerase III subunit chi [Litoreibacter halocynthiae]TDT77558.1 DNA polymerase III chi subunit [Litoreibacter halocynthiae]